MMGHTSEHVRRENIYLGQCRIICNQEPLAKVRNQNFETATFARWERISVVSATSMVGC